MRKLLILVFLCAVVFANAQVVNIPDPGFKYFLISQGIDANSNGEIEQAEALPVTALNIPIGQVSDLTGIRSFANLQTLDCDSNSLKTLDVSGLTELQTLDCSDNFGITLLSITGCTSLKILDCHNNKLTVLDLNGFVNLKTLDCSRNNLKTFHIANHANIESINIANNSYRNYYPDTGLISFNASNCPKLGAVYLSDDFTYYNLNSIITANLSGCGNLTTLNVHWAVIETLNISGCKDIKEVTGFTVITNLIANNCTALTTIETQGTGGACASLNVTGCTNLETVHFSENNSIDTIDLSTCPNIKRVFFASLDSYCPYVNVKNGSRMIDCTLGVRGADGGPPPCINICADDFEIDAATNWLHFVNIYPTYPAVNINPYCSFTPAGDYNTIQGKIKLDVNNNGCSNTNRAMPYVPLIVTDTTGNTYINYTDGGGEYERYFYAGHFTIKPYFPYPYFFVNPTTAPANFDTANHLVAENNFCIQPDGVHNDLEISLLPIGPARPGFKTFYALVFKNRGTSTLSGSITVNFDNNRMIFLSSSENVATQSTGQLTWNYYNLEPFQSRTINIDFNFLPPPVNNIGDTIYHLASITPSVNDETAFDNSFVLPQLLVMSFDPNDKQCLEGSKLDISKISNYLHYQIHFQNEGTDTAFNIVVADTLSNKLDWNSLELISSSHPCTVQQSNGSVEFIFENIKLPYKAINEPASNGFVAFKIKPKPTVVIGDSLNNKAAIYFDFNLPVITNTATTIVSSTSTTTPVKLEYFSVSSSNGNVLKWKANCTSSYAAFSIEKSNDGLHFTSIGNINSSFDRCQLPFSFTDDKPLAGKNYYRLKITDADGKSFYSKVLSSGINKPGITILAVANNTIYFSNTKQQAAEIKLLGADGKLFYTAKKTIPAGAGQMNIAVKNLAAGIYTLVVFTGDGIITKRFIK